MNTHDVPGLPRRLTLRPLLLLLATLAVSMPSCSDPTPGRAPRSRSTPDQPVRIALQPFGRFDRVMLDSVRRVVRRTYGAGVIVLGERDLPRTAFVNIKTPRYRADSLLVLLRAEKPDSLHYILGLTAQDISTTKYNADGTIKHPPERYRDFGVFGLGFLGGPSCVVSTFRLGRGASPALRTTRLQKVAVHELGHTMGLPHCPDPACVMRDAVERISTIDAARCELCVSCRARIRP